MPVYHCQTKLLLRHIQGLVKIGAIPEFTEETQIPRIKRIVMGSRENVHEE